MGNLSSERPLGHAAEAVRKASFADCVAAGLIRLVHTILSMTMAQT